MLSNGRYPIEFGWIDLNQTNHLISDMYSGLQMLCQLQALRRRCPKQPISLNPEWRELY